MEYTIKKMAEISGVSPRTLRFYDEINLLKPARITSSGYRIYSSHEVDRLQHILFYRSLEFKLEKIKEILDNPTFDHQKALIEHQKMLLEKREQIDTLLTTIQQTLNSSKGGKPMQDHEKFEGLKKQKITENEKNYGQEIRTKYGNHTIDESNKKWQNMEESTFKEMKATEKQLLIDLSTYLNNQTDQKLADRIFETHKKWLSFTWPTYSSEAHRGLGQMYVADERFTSYYDDRCAKGAAKALHSIIQTHTSS
ncbi:MerR family transcriptional regulator [Enterococcus villorum]|uniref:MerR family transcriptional regulator n=1 Tax=Enterococcus villorum TaxID=112904 RepID=UPI003F88837C